MSKWSRASVGTEGKALVWILLAALGACATTRADPTRRAPAGDLSATVEVRNQTQNAVTVYLWSSSFRDRLGMVEAGQHRTFDFQWRLSVDAQFIMDFLAQGCTISESIPVNEGDELLLTIQPVDRRRASELFCRG